MLTLTTWSWVPPFAQGLVRDIPVRWALEELGLPYHTRLIGSKDTDFTAHLARQPFGQVPVLEDDNLTLFESGAIALHLAAHGEPLMPADPAGQARATVWVFAALNSIETAIDPLVDIDLFHAGDDRAQARRPAIEQHLRHRLGQLAAWLGEREYLEGRFTVGDLMMASVLRILRHTDLVATEPRLAAYLHRCEARPAFQCALRDHMEVFAEARSVG
jgi:glutathione S-transferase